MAVRRCTWPLLMGHKEMAELLIAKGADVNAKDKMAERRCTGPPLGAKRKWPSC